MYTSDNMNSQIYGDGQIEWEVDRGGMMTMSSMMNNIQVLICVFFHIDKTTVILY